MTLSRRKPARSSFTLMLLAIALSLVAFSAARAAQAEHVRVTNPNAASVELLGRGMLYTVNFDRVVTDDLVAGVGFGTTSLRDLNDNDSGFSTALIPVYANYYFMRDGNSLFATAGAAILTNSGAANGRKATFSGVEFNSTPVIPQFGVGFESRSDAGFLFRATAYGIVSKNIRPWFGFTLGYSF